MYISICRTLFKYDKKYIFYISCQNCFDCYKKWLRLCVNRYDDSCVFSSNIVLERYSNDENKNLLGHVDFCRLVPQTTRVIRIVAVCLAWFNLSDFEFHCSRKRLQCACHCIHCTFKLYRFIVRRRQFVVTQSSKVQNMQTIWILTSPFETVFWQLKATTM